MFVAPVIVLPPASCTVSTGWVAQVTALALLELGWVVKASLAAGPTVMEMAELVAVKDPCVALRV